MGKEEQYEILRKIVINVDFIRIDLIYEGTN